MLVRGSLALPRGCHRNGTAAQTLGLSDLVKLPERLSAALLIFMLQKYEVLWEKFPLSGRFPSWVFGGFHFLLAGPGCSLPRLADGLPH